MCRTTNVFHAHFHLRTTSVRIMIERTEWDPHKAAGYLHGRVDTGRNGVQLVIDDHMDLEIIDFGKHDEVSSVGR